VTLLRKSNNWLMRMPGQGVVVINSDRYMIACGLALPKITRCWNKFHFDHVRCKLTRMNRARCVDDGSIEAEAAPIRLRTGVTWPAVSQSASALRRNGTTYYSGWTVTTTTAATTTDRQRRHYEYLQRRLRVSLQRLQLLLLLLLHRGRLTATGSMTGLWRSLLRSVWVFICIHHHCIIYIFCIFYHLKWAATGICFRSSVICNIYKWPRRWSH